VGGISKSHSFNQYNTIFLNNTIYFAAL